MVYEVSDMTQHQSTNQEEVGLSSDDSIDMSSLSTNNTSSSSFSRQKNPQKIIHHRLPKRGDIVTINFHLKPPSGYIPEPLFDTHGIQTSLVLGWGNYLPGLHHLISKLHPGGESVENVSLDAGWGERNPDLLVKIARKKGSKKGGLDHDSVTVGTEVVLSSGGISVVVVEVTEESIVVDANPPLAGSFYLCDLTLLSVQSGPDYGIVGESSDDDDDDDDDDELSTDSLQRDIIEEEEEDDNIITATRYEVATFALGCFWGGELAFMRTPGVVGTRVGYTQGRTSDPTYEKVCTGTTHHVEAILVVFDPSIVSYVELLRICLGRLAATDGWKYNSRLKSIERVDNDDDDDVFISSSDLDHDNVNYAAQYRHGFYYHTSSQEQDALRILQSAQNRNGPDGQYARWARTVEVKPSTKFYEAEEYHQQYLLKGGQNARRGAKETIRCYG